MSTSQSNELTQWLATQWKRLSVWRAMRKYAWIARQREKMERAYVDANRLMGRSARPPMPLWDHIDNREGR